MSTSTSSHTPAKGLVESRSIDWVPLNERHGRPWTLFPLWFMSNANVTTLTTGMLGAALGATFGASLLAIVLGVAVGTVFTAFHSAQGPQLGLPQMIQSRAQFGYRGVILICAIVVFSLVGFNMFNQMLAAEILTTSTGLDAGGGWYILISGIAVLLAIFGYSWIHRTQTWLTGLFLLTFGVFTVVAPFVVPLPADALSLANINWVAFLVQFGGAAAYALGWAPYVSDYSRYLPPQTSPARALGFTYGGVFVGAVWLMALGAFIAAGFVGAAPLQGVRDAADAFLPGSGIWLLVAALPGLISVITINIYAASLELITIVDSVRPIRPTRTVRVVACLVIAAAAVIGSLLSTGDFLSNFGSFLVILLYVLVPWTAINLIDYYFVRRGQYAVSEIFKQDGVYGSWGWRGLAAYGIGIIAMIPFVVTVWFTGPVAAALGGADIALFIGLAASAIAYLLFSHSLDTARERAVAAQDRIETGHEAVAFGRLTTTR
ncbi:cytosine permease [Salinibacterium xinjiangense]|uniref:Purine-cytosine permease n=1 Tax=Salinibacterium xinjiangense TaxID=386302 RepID=A0A2C8Z6E4_9MICO|nr:cytosine permease [Salinibacterium xinjiangense]GGK92627.1 cytosine permease [Salinibacterium xinjiangense]SOE59342.1 Purine-cytosine permease [Salinibacterium xinjiangense]